MCQLSYVLSPFTHAHHSLARDQRRSQCCHIVCITYCCAAAAAARQSESPQSPDQVPGSPSGASSSSFSSLINYDDNYDDDTTTTTTTTNDNSSTPPVSPLPRGETLREEPPPESIPLCITFNRTTTPTFIIHHVRQAHQCPHYTNVCIEERPRDWFYYGSMLAVAVEALPRAREGYTLSWRWVWERMPLASREDGGGDGGGGASGEREGEREEREGRNRDRGI